MTAPPSRSTCPGAARPSRAGRPTPRRAWAPPARPLERGVYVDQVDGEPFRAFVTDLATGLDLGELVYDMASLSARWPADVVFQASGVGITPDGATALVGVQGLIPGEGLLTDRGALAVFDTDTQRQRAVIDLPWRVHAIAVTPDGRRAVLNGGSGYAIVDLAADRLHGPARPPRGGRDEQRSAGGRRGVPRRPARRHWPATTRSSSSTSPPAGSCRRAQVAEAEDQVVQAIAWSGDSTTVVAGSSAGWLHFVSADDARAGRPRPAHHRRVGDRPRDQPRRADPGQHRQRW